MPLMLQRHIAITGLGYQVPDADADQGTTALLTVESGAIRYLTNGDAPSGASGNLAVVGSTIRLGPLAMRNFRAVQVGEAVVNAALSIYDGEDATATHIIAPPGSRVRSGQTNCPVANITYPLADGLGVYQVTIKALPDNTGLVYIGDAGNMTLTVNTGYPLASNVQAGGADQVTIFIDNLADVLVLAAQANDGVAYIASLP